MTEDPTASDGRVTMEPDHDLIGKFFSAGFTLLGLAFPAMAATLGLLRQPDISSTYADALGIVVWVLLPGILLTTAQLLVCLGTLCGWIASKHPAIWLTVALLTYLSLGLTIWALYETGVL